MAHLVPSISFIKEFKQRLLNGESVSQSLDILCRTNNSPFIIKVRKWWFYKKAGKSYKKDFSTDYQKTLISILESGLKGASVLEPLNILEAEMLKEFDRQWKAFLETLPFKLMIPLLLFFFPSYVILLFGPLFVQFLSEVSP